MRINRREAALLAASILAAAIMGEVALRAMGVSYPIVHRLDALRGWAPWPGASGVSMIEGGAHVAINREGFRDREHSPRKPEGTFRLAVLGDSMTEALGVAADKTFPAVLERELAACEALAGNRVEVLNFGVTGYGTAQELVTLRENVIEYHPDLVLLAFFAGNDVYNNSRELDGHSDRVYFELVDGRLVLDDSNTRRLGFRLKAAFRNGMNAAVNMSRLIQLVRESYYRVRQPIKFGRMKQGTLFDPETNEYAVYREPADEAWRYAWSMTEALLAAMNDDVRAAGGRFWIAALTTPPQIYPDPAVRRAFMRGLGVPSLDYPDNRIAAFAESQGIPVVVLTSALLPEVEKEKAFLHGFEETVPGIGHWNETGHRLGGERIARAICRGL